MFASALAAVAAIVHVELLSPPRPSTTPALALCQHALAPPLLVLPCHAPAQHPIQSYRRACCSNLSSTAKHPSPSPSRAAKLHHSSIAIALALITELVPFILLAVDSPLALPIFVESEP